MGSSIYSLKIVWASCSEHQSYAETQYSSSSVFVTSEDQELINENSPNLPTKVRLTALGTCVGAIFIQIKQCTLWLILVQFVQWWGNMRTSSSLIQQAMSASSSLSSHSIATFVPHATFQPIGNLKECSVCTIWCGVNCEVYKRCIDIYTQASDQFPAQHAHCSVCTMLCGMPVEFTQVYLIHFR